MTKTGGDMAYYVPPSKKVGDTRPPPNCAHVHTNQHITESRSKTFGRRNTQPCLNVSFIERWQTFATSQSLIATFVLVLCTLSDILGTVVERDALMSSLGTNRD